VGLWRHPGTPLADLTATLLILDEGRQPCLPELAAPFHVHPELSSMDLWSVTRKKNSGDGMGVAGSAGASAKGNGGTGPAAKHEVAPELAAHSNRAFTCKNTCGILNHYQKPLPHAHHHSLLAARAPSRF